MTDTQQCSPLSMGPEAKGGQISPQVIAMQFSIKGTQVFHLGPESEHTSCLGAFCKEPMSQKHSSQSSESPLPSKAGGQF